MSAPQDRQDSGATTPGVDRLALSINESCRALSISRAEFYRRLHAGEIRAFKIGKRTLIAVEELKRYISSCPALHPHTVEAPNAQRT